MLQRKLQRIRFAFKEWMKDQNIGFFFTLLINIYYNFFIFINLSIHYFFYTLYISLLIYRGYEEYIAI